ncbi:MAG: thiamine pyrophosphate-dependent dehydrogenase E1 component subunit alpha [Gemmataceae bacterium]|nr:thiamine pyrophosphate-dependent dehydrogenase E1 component subunit alpha [Gemmataceae bacterium]MCI0737599.1 thiamine pyrophosphate-dependent dehydrogenase E1 component subunit alpha [Gemmataceae bacterium]
MTKSASAQVDSHIPAPGSLGTESLPRDRCLELHRIMVRARAMEERMIKMSKSGEGYFWIGGPGEEAFNAALGLLIKKGEGPDFDFLHLHYRNSATMVAMGMPMIDGIRQMAMTATDPHSFGRNFPGHFAFKKWNVTPISSVIENQFVIAPGTAIVQKRRGGDAVTIVVGGESGSAEGDFASCLIWSTRPGNELPVLMIVMNNGWGISTPHGSQHGAKNVIDRGKPFGIPGEVVEGNDPVASWFAIKRALEYCRKERRAYMLEAKVSRLYGHSSSSGAPRSSDPDCIAMFEEKLLVQGWLSQEAIERLHAEAKAEADAAAAQAVQEEKPHKEHVERFTYAPSSVDKVYPGDYTGVPQRIDD